MRVIKYLGVIGLAIFTYILWATGPEKILQNFLGLDPFFLLLTVFVLVVTILFKAYKQTLLVNAFGAKFGLVDSAKIWLIGFFFATITPGKSGDFIKSFYISEKTSLPLGKCLTSVVVERFFDVLVLFILGFSGIVFLSSSIVFHVDLILPLGLFFLTFLALVWLFTRKGFLRFAMKPFFNYLVPERFRHKLRISFHQFFEGLSVYKSKKFLMLWVFLLTILLWFFAVAQYFLIAFSLHAMIPFFFLLAIMPLVELLSILPISFSGIGTREASLVFFLSLLAIDANTAVSFSLLIFFFAIALGLVGFIFLSGEKRLGILGES